jgi:hypothetical protein
VVVAEDARAFVATRGGRYAAFTPSGSSSTWRVAALSGAGDATTLGTQERFADNVALASDNDGALLALTLLDDAGGAVYRFEAGGKVTALLEGERFKAKFTSVVGAGDYVFAGSPLVRFHKPSGRAKALGVDDVVQLAAAEGTLFVAEQAANARWRIRSTPYATSSLLEVAKGNGIVYGLAASVEGVAWTTTDTSTLPAAETATGSVWLRRGKSGAPVRLAHGLPSPMGVALDSTHVYVAVRGGRGSDAANGAIVRIPLGGGAPENVAVDVGAPIVVTVDDARVYTLAESTVQASAPYNWALTYVSVPGDVLAFDKPRPASGP